MSKWEGIKVIYHMKQICITAIFLIMINVIIKTATTSFWLNVQQKNKVESAFIDYGHKLQNYFPVSCNQFSKNCFVMKVNPWHLMPKWLLATHWTLEFRVCYVVKSFLFRIRSFSSGSTCIQKQQYRIE